MVKQFGPINGTAPASTPLRRPIDPPSGTHKDPAGRLAGGESTGRAGAPIRPRIGRDPDGAVLARPPQRPTVAAQRPQVPAQEHTDAAQTAKPLPNPVFRASTPANSPVSPQPSTKAAATLPEVSSAHVPPGAKKQVTFNVEANTTHNFKKADGENKPFVKVTESPGREIRGSEPQVSYNLTPLAPKREQNTLSRIAEALNPFANRN